MKKAFIKQNKFIWSLLGKAEKRGLPTIVATYHTLEPRRLDPALLEEEEVVIFDIRLGNKMSRIYTIIDQVRDGRDIGKKTPWQTLGHRQQSYIVLANQLPKHRGFFIKGMQLVTVMDKGLMGSNHATKVFPHQKSSDTARGPCCSCRRWYSPTRFSKKLVFPCKEIISIQSNGFVAL